MVHFTTLDWRRYSCIWEKGCAAGENFRLSGADPEKMVTGLCERSERDERQRAVSSEARNTSWGVWGGAPENFSIFNLYERKILDFSKHLSSINQGSTPNPMILYDTWTRTNKNNSKTCLPLCNYHSFQWYFHNNNFDFFGPSVMKLPSKKSLFKLNQEQLFDLFVNFCFTLTVLSRFQFAWFFLHCNFPYFLAKRETTASINSNTVNHIELCISSRWEGDNTFII